MLKRLWSHNKIDLMHILRIALFNTYILTINEKSLILYDFHRTDLNGTDFT